jgi:F-type H+-transporting ATPase subunit b
MRHGFGLNINLFETNVLNLFVVLGVVVTVVGDAFRDFLEQRRKIILSTLQEASKKARGARQRLDDARRVVEIARFRAKEIRIQAVQVAEEESFAIQERVRNDLQRLQERGQQTIKLERQKVVQSITQQVAGLALMTAESTLSVALGDQGLLTQKELNGRHVRESFRRIEKVSLVLEPSQGNKIF